jgi:chromate transporter
MKTLFKLFFSFFRIGLFTIGGGYAMLPLMEKEAVDNNHWVTKEEMLDIYTMSQCTPGVIAVNTATFIGRKEKGVAGAAFATLGVVAPRLIIITLIATLFKNYAENPYVIRALVGVRCAVAALILTSTYRIVVKAVKSPIQIGILIAGFVTVAFLGSSPVAVIVVAGILGLFLFDARPKEKEVKNDE